MRSILRKKDNDFSSGCKARPNDCSNTGQNRRVAFFHFNASSAKQRSICLFSLSDTVRKAFMLYCFQAKRKGR